MAERNRSLWGWGYADRFPDRAGREALAQQISGVLGFSGLEVEQPRDFDPAKLIAPSCTLPDAFERFCTVEPRARASHTYGRAYRDIVRGFRGEFGGAPAFVAKPTCEEEVEQVLAWASDQGVVVVPFGGGTSVVGGVECDNASQRAVLSLDTRNLAQVLEVDLASRAARIQAGATGPLIEEQLAVHNLSLRHYPQSFEFSTLGGWLATRAGGHFATRYTRIDDLVESIRMVTPAGTFESPRLPSSGAGPDPNRMVLGSEGTLGVITEAWMRVFERPRFRSSASVGFQTFSSGMAALREMLQAGLTPANCRLLDEREAKLFGVSFQGDSVLLLGFESSHHPMHGAMKIALDVTHSHGGQNKGEPRHQNLEEAHEGRDAASSSWRQAFFEAPYMQSTLVSLGVMADTFETACTWSHFDAMHAAIIHDVRAALKEVCGQGFLSTRITHVYPDGPAPYYTFVAPVTPGSELSQWAEVKAAATEAICRHGGAVTHHHAVGRVHRPWHGRQSPPLWSDALRAVKATLDPNAILNPGVLFDPQP